MDTKKIRRLIKEKSYLFWWIREKENISIDLLVEAILNYGNEKDIKKLFDLVGIKNVEKIFKKQIARKRKNYQPRTIHFFNLYFKQNA